MAPTWTDKADAAVVAVDVGVVAGRPRAARAVDVPTAGVEAARYVPGVTDTPQDPTSDPGAVLAHIPFSASLGMTLDAATADEVRGTMSWRPELCTGGGLMHGGAVMAFADTLGAVCAFLNLPAGAGTSTIESKTNLFRGVRDGAVHGTASPLHVGRTTIVVQTDVRDAAGKRVALVTQTQAVLTR